MDIVVNIDWKVQKILLSDMKKNFEVLDKEKMNHISLVVNKVRVISWNSFYDKVIKAVVVLGVSIYKKEIKETVFNKIIVIEGIKVLVFLKISDLLVLNI